MSSLVVFQISIRDKLLAAEGTSKHFLPRMGPNMLKQATLVFVFFTAALEWAFLNFILVLLDHDFDLLLWAVFGVDVQLDGQVIRLHVALEDEGSGAFKIVVYCLEIKFIFIDGNFVQKVFGARFVLRSFGDSEPVKINVLQLLVGDFLDALLADFPEIEALFLVETQDAVGSKGESTILILDRLLREKPFLLGLALNGSVFDALNYLGLVRVLDNPLLGF